MTSRIKQVMEYKQLSPAQFAEIIEINRSNLTHIFSGRNQPSLDLARKILTAFPDISTEWLIMGVGDMLNESGNYIPVQSKRPLDLFDTIEEPENIISEAVDVEVPPIDDPTEINSDNVIQIEKEKPKEAKGRRTMKSSSYIHTKTNASDSNIPGGTSQESKILQSQEDKKVKKIIFFYEDNTFKTFYPSIEG